MTTKKQNYFCDLFKSGYIIHTLLFAALTCTLIVFGYATDLWGLIFNNKSFFILSVATVGLFAFITFIYIIANAKKSKIGMTDALALSTVITAIFYLCFLVFFLKDYNTQRIIVLVGILVVSC